MSTRNAPTRDLRAVRTRTALHQALLDLLDEHSFEQVTVRQLTDRASVNRASFYRHYRDKEDLALSVISDAVDVYLAEAMPADGGSTAQGSAPHTWTALFDHVSANASLYRALLRTRSPSLHRSLHQMLSKAVPQRIAASGGPHTSPLIPPEFGVALVAGAVVGAFSWWLEHPDPPPSQDVADWVFSFAAHGYLTAMGFPTAKDA